MSEHDFDEVLELLVDFCNALESACVNLKHRVAELKSVIEAKRKWRWNPDAIKWEKAEGWKGEYERSEDVNNPQFKAMLRDLAQHNGKLTRNGMFYWVFKNGSTVGRKKRAESKS